MFIKPFERSRQTLTSILFPILFASVAAAAPTVTSVAGRVSQGETVTIRGSGFLDKSPAAPLVWADFEQGIQPSPLGINKTWNEIGSMGWSTEGFNGTRGAKATDGVGIWLLRADFDAWTRDGQKFYVFRRQRMNFLITDTSQNWKSWRMWPASTGYPNIYAAPSNGRVYVEQVGAESGFWGNMNPRTTNWYAEELIGQASSAPGVKDGRLTVRFDGRQSTSGTLMTRSASKPALMTKNYVVHGVQANPSRWNPAWQSSNRMWVDDVYADTTWARVMLGNASTYSSVTRMEPQIPTTWSNGSISVVANTDLFPAGSTAYLYVVDKNGNVNSNGFPVVVGSGSGAANQAPSANAGSDQTVLLNETAVLSGSASDDGLPNPPGAVTSQWTQVSGPAAATIANASALQTGAVFSQAGVYVFRLTASDSVEQAWDDVTVTVNAPPANEPPSVSAGADGTVNAGEMAVLDGAADDDGLPNPPGTFTTQWAQVSGPAAATIADASALRTNVLLPEAGLYSFRLTGDDASEQAWDDVILTAIVPSPGNAAPTVNAGVNRTVLVSETVPLQGTVTDDGLPDPPGALTTKWTQLSGAVPALIGDVAALHTTVAFSEVGTYEFALGAFDGEFAIEDRVIFTVKRPKQTAPVVSAGRAVTVPVGEPVLLAGDVGVQRVSASAATIKWERLSGPGAVTFEDPAALKTRAWFAQSGRYWLRLTATEGSLSSSDMVEVTAVQPAQVTAMRNLINPMKDESAQFQVEMMEAGSAAVEVYDRFGVVIRTLRETVPSGISVLDWNGRNDVGSVVASGLYYVSIKVAETLLPLQKVVVIK